MLRLFPDFLAVQLKYERLWRDFKTCWCAQYVVIMLKAGFGGARWFNLDLCPMYWLLWFRKHLLLRHEWSKSQCGASDVLYFTFSAYLAKLVSQTMKLRHFPRQIKQTGTIQATSPDLKVSEAIPYFPNFCFIRHVILNTWYFGCLVCTLLFTFCICTNPLYMSSQTIASAPHCPTTVSLVDIGSLLQPRDPVPSLFQLVTMATLTWWLNLLNAMKVCVVKI